MFEIQYDNDVVINSTAKNWRVKDIIVTDVETENKKSAASGVPGSNFYGQNIGDRNGITLIFEFRFNDIKDYERKRSEVYRDFNYGPGKLFMSNQSVYLGVIKTSIGVNRVSMIKANVSVVLETVELPFFESRQMKTQTYSNLANITHTNSGDVELDHRYTNTKYEILFRGSASFFQITLNGVRWRFTGSISSGDELVIEKGTAYFNGQDVLESTTMNIIILAPGQNTLEILGSMQYQLRIITKEYYY